MVGKASEVEAPRERMDAAFEQAFRLSPVALGIVRVADSCVIDVNEAAAALAGRTREEIVGHTTIELGLWIDESRRLDLKMQLAAHSELRDIPVQLARKDGEVRDALMSVGMIDIAGERCMLAAITDITDKLATQRLLEEAQRLGHVGSWTIDLRRGGVRWSDEAKRIFGYPEPPRDTQEFLTLVDPEDRARVAANIELALHGGGSLAHEYRFLRPDGERRWVFVRAAVECDQTGRPTRLTGSIQDITERHEADARLAASEQRHRRIVETSAQGIVMVAADGVVSFANGRIAALLATTPEAMIGRRFRELIDPSQLAEVDERRARRIAGVTDTYDIKLVRDGGDRVLAEITAMPLLDAGGQHEGTLLMISDVTLRRQAEEARARLAAIVESSRDAIASWTREGIIETWNSAAERMFGYSAAEIIGQDIAMLVPPDRVPSHLDSVEALLRGDVVAVETVRRRKDGTAVDVSLTRSPVLDREGRVIAVSSIARDITAQKRLEASLREAEENLRHAQKMEAIGALAGGIAHDFNNLLSVMLSCAGLIEDALDAQDPIAEDARAIREAAERAATLTRQLLAFSRRQVLEPRVINLDRTIAGMEKMLRRLLGERIQLVIVPSRASNVLIDPSQFEQVLLNLAVNARDAMPGGGELTIESAHVVLPDGPFVKVTVTDTGTGMDEQTQARMFEPFFTTKAVGKGTGLGLATVFGIIEQSGGFVRVRSAHGRGTSVEVHVPHTERTERAPDPRVEAASIQTRGETILVVEDEEPVRKLVQKLLRRQGYQVITAANAGEALLIAEQKPHLDLLLTDVVMPLMNGRQLAERLRALYPTLRVVFMSGYHDDEVLRDMLGDPELAYLQKPVPRELLVRRIREMLDRR